jgi:hypothetical protein
VNWISSQILEAQGLKKRMDELARKYTESHGEDIKAELGELSRRIVEMKNRLICRYNSPRNPPNH